MDFRFDMKTSIIFKRGTSITWGAMSNKVTPHWHTRDNFNTSQNMILQSLFRGRKIFINAMHKTISSNSNFLEERLFLIRYFLSCMKIFGVFLLRMLNKMVVSGVYFIFMLCFAKKSYWFNSLYQFILSPKI